MYATAISPLAIEGCPAGHESEGDGKPADELDHAAEPELRSDRGLEVRQDAKDLLEAMEGEHQPGDDPEKRVEDIGLRFQVASDHRFSPISAVIPLRRCAGPRGSALGHPFPCPLNNHLGPAAESRCRR